MKIAIIGAGAIGGFLAVRLAAAGHQVSVVIRGEHLKAVKARGLKLVSEEGIEEIVQVQASDRMSDFGIQDLVIMTMKAHQVAGMIDDMTNLLGPETLIITAQNGIPWWYFKKYGGPFDGKTVESVDPQGTISKRINVDNILGSVVYFACEISAPGVIQHIEGNKFSLGEIDGANTDRLKQMVDIFKIAGVKSPISNNIRSEIWLKLWGNLTFNPISALTHSTLVDICTFPPTHDLAVRMMSEAQAVGEKLGIVFKVGIEQRIAGAAAVGKHKTSMLQDIESGRPIELDALLTSVIEMGNITEVATPTIATVHALLSLLSKTLQEQKGKLQIIS